MSYDAWKLASPYDKGGPYYCRTCRSDECLAENHPGHEDLCPDGCGEWADQCACPAGEAA